MREQAPLSYIADYYESVQRRIHAFPEIAEFWLSALRHVSGSSVLNLGCGPMLYDNLAYFSRVPDHYVGLDINAASFDFLANGTHPALTSARNQAKASCEKIDFIAGDVFDYCEALEGRFDVVLGVGFFATFDGDEFDRLIKATYAMLRPAGRLVKITWHGPHRSDAEKVEKMRYSFDNQSDPSAEELTRHIKAQGFDRILDELLTCPTETVGWDLIQRAIFEKRSNCQQDGL